MSLTAPMRVSARDVEIFRKVSIEGKSQRQVAGEYKLSQPRVAAIMKRMRRWSEQPLVKGLDESCRLEKLAGLVRAHRWRLVVYRDLAMEAFRQSQTVHVVKQYFDADEKKIKEERTGKSAGGNVRFVDFARKFDERLLEFEGVARDGSVDLQAANRIAELSSVSRDEMMEDMEQFIERVTPELEKWRAEKERQASVAALARRGEGVRSADCGVVSEETAASAVITEKVGIALSESLSREGAGNSAVEATSAGVIGTVIGVIGAAADASSSQPEAAPAQTGPADERGLQVKAGPEAQPAKKEKALRDEFFQLFRERLPRMQMDLDDPKGRPRISCSPGIQYPLPEHEIYFDR